MSRRWGLTPFSDAQWQDKGQQEQTEIYKVPPEHEEKLLYFEGVRALEQAAQRAYESPPEYDPVQAALDEAALSGWLDYADGEIISRDPFNPNNSVILWNIKGGKEKGKKKKKYYPYFKLISIQHQEYIRCSWEQKKRKYSVYSRHLIYDSIFYTKFMEILVFFRAWFKASKFLNGNKQ